MDKKLLKKYPYNVQQLIKDEAAFAFAISTRYKMSNTKNKDFVNCMTIDKNEIEKYYNFETLKQELDKLNYYVIQTSQETGLNDNFYHVFKKDEKREIRIKMIFTVEQFL